jgi:hypothetical protein
LCKSAPIDYDDPLLELLPEAYVDSEPPSPDDLAKAVDDMVRETAAFLVRFGKESRAGNYDEAIGDRICIGGVGPRRTI